MNSSTSTNNQTFECGICAEKCKITVTCNLCFNKDPKIKADNVESLITCKKCVQKYILDQPREASCMICRNQWTTGFLYTNFTKNFLHGEYRKHLKNLYIQREKSLIPETMQFVSARKQAMEIDEHIKKRNAEIAILNERVKALVAENNEAQRVKYDLQAFITNGASLKSDKEKSTQIYECPCPNEGCRGLIEIESKSCAVCSTKICFKCYDIIQPDQEHECEEVKKQNASDIKKHTKPCPKCATRIFRIEGCAMMFCTICKTPFSWTTLEILRGTIHNPHYFEWMRQMQTPTTNINLNMDFQCGQLPDFRDQIRNPFLRLFNNVPGSKDVFELLSDLYRLIAHFHDVELRGLRNRQPTFASEIDKRQRRISFIIGTINEEELKKYTLIAERKLLKLSTTREIVESFVTISVERVQTIARQLITLANIRTPTNQQIVAEYDNIRNLMREIQTLIDMANNSLKNEILLLGFDSYPIIGKHDLTYHNATKEKREKKALKKRRIEEEELNEEMNQLIEMETLDNI